MHLVCLCVRYTVHGANIWTNGGVLGSYCQINTWTTTKSGDSIHSFYKYSEMYPAVSLPPGLVCVSVWLLCYSMWDKELHVLFCNDRLMSFISNTSLFHGYFLMTLKSRFLKPPITPVNLDSNVLTLWHKFWTGKPCIFLSFSFVF